MWGLFQPKELRVLDVLPLSLAFCGFVVFTNLSLTYNTVGFYQVGGSRAHCSSSLSWRWFRVAPFGGRKSVCHPDPSSPARPLPQLAKVMTTPVIVVVQFAYYGIRFSRPILLSLVSVLYERSAEA
jgi:solute carrier family 35 protein E3